MIEYAARINNVAEACRTYGVSFRTYYEWLKRAEQSGLSALLQGAAQAVSAQLDVE